MKRVQSSVDEVSVRSFLQERFGQRVSRLTLLDAGQVSRTFAFTHQGADYVV
jgi:hypothetical protein